MKKKTLALIFVFISVLLVNIGQLVLKKGLNDLGGVDFSLGVFGMFLNAFSNVFVILGFAFVILSSITWLLALSKTQLSYAFPLLGFGYVVVVILSWLLLGESLSLLRILGLGFIVVGVVGQTKS
jgi:multidrug transporter EmrE-like cation transporter